MHSYRRRAFFNRRNEPEGAPFIAVFDTTKAGSASDTLVLPITDGVAPNYTVDWGDGNVTNNISTHTYDVGGEYTVKLLGDYDYFRFAGGGDRQKISDIQQFGDLRLAATTNSNSGAFKGCVNLDITATDVPNLPAELAGFFRDCSSLVFNNSINSWITSSVSNITEFFVNCSLFNQDISGWDITGCDSLLNLFKGASVFNQNINSWNTASITYMGGCFSGAMNFNQPLYNWNVSNVTDMRGMFLAALNFNQDITGWDVSSVQYFGASNNGMFYNADAFNQAIGVWNTSSAKSFQQMFRSANSFDQDLSNWVITNLTGTNCLEAFLFQASLNTANYDALLISWESQGPGTGFNANFGNSQYSALGETARSNLISTYGWTINDGGLAA